MMKYIFDLKEHKKSDEISLFRLMAPSLLSIFLCTACLLGTTWAWFTRTETVSVAAIQAASVRLEKVTVTRDGASAIAEESAEPEVHCDEEVALFYAEANTEYHVHAEMDGTASRGYLVVDTPDGTFYTSESEVDFTLLLANGDNVSISASWSEPDADAKYFESGERLGNGVIIADTPSEGETVEGDSSSSEDTAQDNIQMETNNGSTTPSAVSVK